MKTIGLWCLFFMLSFQSMISQNIHIGKQDKEVIEVKKAEETLLIDGTADDTIWSQSEWHPIDQLWLGEAYDANDFKGHFKLTWTNEALFLLAEITDNTLFDQNKDPLKFWWDDDCMEVFIDEDNSGGEHQYNHNAFAYHVALDGNVVDMSTDRAGKLYNDHVRSKHITKGNTTTWELKISIFDDTFKEDGNNKPVTLYAGKKIGFALAYCDNDGSEERENFIGSIFVSGKDKNQGWMDADIFGTILLKD